MVGNGEQASESPIPKRRALSLQSVSAAEFLRYGELSGVDVCRHFWWEQVPDYENVFADLEAGKYQDQAITDPQPTGHAPVAFPESYQTVVAYRPVLANLLNIDTVTNIFLCQLIHWDSVTGGDFFFHTREQWQVDTSLTRPQQERARKVLGPGGLGILEEEAGQRLNRTHYRLNRERLLELCEKDAPGLLAEILPTLFGQLAENQPTLTGELATNQPTSRTDTSQQLAEKSPTEEIYKEKKEEIPPLPTRGGRDFSDNSRQQRKTQGPQPEGSGDGSRLTVSLIADMPRLATEVDFEATVDDSNGSEGHRLFDQWCDWQERHSLHDYTHDALQPYIEAFGISGDSGDSLVRLCDRLARGLTEVQLGFLGIWADEAVKILQFRGEDSPQYYFTVLKRSFEEDVSPLKRDTLTR